MIIQHLRLDAINGSLVELDGVQDASFDEIVNFKLDDGTQRTGRIVKIDGEHITVQDVYKRQYSSSCRVRIRQGALRSYAEGLS